MAIIGPHGNKAYRPPKKKKKQPAGRPGGRVGDYPVKKKPASSHHAAAPSRPAAPHHAATPKHVPGHVNSIKPFIAIAKKSQAGKSLNLKELQYMQRLAWTTRPGGTSTEEKQLRQAQGIAETWIEGLKAKGGIDLKTKQGEKVNIGAGGLDYHPFHEENVSQPTGHYQEVLDSYGAKVPSLTPPPTAVPSTPVTLTPQAPAAPNAPPKTYDELLDATKPKTESTQEQSLADITNPYYAQQKAFPDPVTTLQLLLNKGTIPQNPEESKNLYEELWSPTADATDAEQTAIRAGDMFYMDKGDLTDGVTKGKVEQDGVKAGGIASAPAPAGSVEMEKRGTLKSGIPSQPSMGAILLAKQYERDIKEPWRVTGADFVGSIIPDEEIIKFKREIAKRLERRGVPIKFDPKSSEWEPEWEKVENKYIFAGQWAYQVYGDYSQNVKANDVMASVRTIAFNRDRVELAARKLGLDTTRWAQSDTVKSTLEAMRYADDDTVKTFSYDEWQFSRPIGMSEMERRAQYVKEFDVERLPAVQRGAYEKETDTAMESLGKAFGVLLWPAKKVVKLPGVGTVLKEMGKDVNEVLELGGPVSVKKDVSYIFAAWNEGFKGLSTGKVMFDYMMSKDQLWRSEAKAKNLAHGGGGYGDPGDPDLSVLLDADNWSRAWKEAGNDSLPYIAFEGTEYAKGGKMAPWVVDVADISNLAIQTAVGAAIDPLLTLGLKTAAHGAFVATRAGFRMGSAYRIDLAALKGMTGSESGFLDLGMPAGGNAGKAIREAKAAENAAGDIRRPSPTQPREFFPGAVDAGNGRVRLSHPDAPGDPVLVKVAKDVEGNPRMQPLERDEFKALDPADAPPRKTLPPTRSLKTYAAAKVKGGLLYYEKKTKTYLLNRTKTSMEKEINHRGLVQEAMDSGVPYDAYDETVAVYFEGGKKVAVRNLAGSGGPALSRDVLNTIVDDLRKSGLVNEDWKIEFEDFRGGSNIPVAGSEKVMDLGTAKGGRPIEPTDFWEHAETLHPDFDPAASGLLPRVAGDFDAYNSYLDDADKVLHKHIADVKSPINPHGIVGENTTMFSLGGGLVESVTRTAKSLIKKREVHTYSPPAFLRTNAELFAKIDDPFVVNRLLKAPEDELEVQKLVKQVAASKSHIEVEGLLRKLEPYGVEIDGGRSAMIKQLRYSLGERGFGQLGWARIFNTMTMYGKSSDIATAAEDTFQVGKAIRMGATTKAGRKAALVQLQDFSRRVYEAHPGGKQKIVDEMWKAFENNLGDKLDDFKAYNRHVLWMRGQRYVDEILGHSYLPKYVIDKKTGERTLVEGSLVLPSDLERSLDGVSQGALRQWDELWAGKETQLGDEVDLLEQGYYNTHVAKPGEPVPTTGKTSGWKDNTRTTSRSDGSEWTETRKYNPKTKKYDITGRTQEKFAHTGVKTGKGKKGGAALTNKRRELARLNRQREQLMTNPAVAQARIDLAKLATEIGATPADIAKMSDAVFDAAARATRRTESAKIVQELGQKKRLSPSEEIKYDTAVNELSDMRTSQPFKQGQIRTHIYHQYDPRIAGWYMTGKAPRNFMLADQLVAEPVMRMFKETVMASLAFPIRVNIGDEIARFVPENVVGRMRSVYKMKKELKLDGTDFTEFELKLRDGMARDWDMGNTSGEWHALTPTESGYYEALRDDLESWAREPIVKKLIASKNFGGVGKFPTNPKDLKGFIRRMRDKRVKNPETGKMEYTQDATDMRNFLDDTYRSIKGKGEGPGTYNTPEFEEWCNNWYDRAKLFSDHEPMRLAMEGKTPTVRELEAWGSGPGKPFLYPVNAPIRNGLSEGVKIGLRNPLYGASALNPYHYMFKYGSSRLMQGIGNWTKKQLFNDRYYTLRNKMIERNKLARAAGEVEITPEEMHRVAGEAAVKYAHQTAYSNSTTMFEDMTRNMVPFISAYRQFFVYWAGAVAKHPLALAAFQKNYPEFLRDPFHFTRDDSQFITPQIPFWAPDSETGTGFWDQVSAQSPSAGLIPLVGVRTVISALGEDPKDYANLPLLKGLGNTMSPFQRIARLAYGLTGDTTLGDISESIFGDHDKLDTAHANAIMAWTKYGPEGSGSEGVNLDNAPLGVKALWALTGGKGGWGEEHLRPEALYNEMTKTLSPTPFGIMYSPKEPREMQSAYFEYQTAMKAGDTKGMNLVRTKYPNFDKDLRFHDASNEEKTAMKKDPANFNMLKWWQSPYNYDNANMEMNPADWQESFFNNGGERLTDAARLAAYHNVITDIYGGHYVTGKKRTSGVRYMGDIKLEALQKGAEKLIQQRKDWAKGVATQLSKSLGVDRADLIYRFENPGGVLKNGRRSGWGTWNDILKSKGLSFDEYDINFISQAAQSEGEARIIPFEVSTEDLSRAFQLKDMMADPNLGNKLISETPESQNISATRGEAVKGVIGATIAMASNTWYHITAEQLQIVTGKKVDPRINFAQQVLKTAYVDWHKSTVGSDEYRNGHNAYYALQKKMLGGLQGGNALVGGLDDRLEHISYFTEPIVTTIGSGKRSAEQLAAWNSYVKVRDKQIGSSSPNSDAIESAWAKFSDMGGAKDQERKKLEIGRVRMWHRVLEMAHVARAKLKNSYSDYYKAKGNSAESKYGKSVVAPLNATINQMARVNPRFKNDIKEYFYNSDNVGGRLCDWYNY